PSAALLEAAARPEMSSPWDTCLAKFLGCGCEQHDRVNTALQYRSELTHIRISGASRLPLRPVLRIGSLPRAHRCPFSPVLHGEKVRMRGGNLCDVGVCRRPSPRPSPH